MNQGMRRTGILGFLVVAVLIVAASAGYPALTRRAAAAPAATSAVTIEAFSFKPRTVQVKVGAKVTWTNNDDVTHTVTSGTPEQRTNEFNQTLQGKGAKFEFTFSKVGTFTYFCTRHNSMRGEVVVKE